MLDQIRAFHLVVKRFHLRFEDDYFAEMGKPFSFGILLDEFKCSTVESQD